MRYAQLFVQYDIQLCWFKTVPCICRPNLTVCNVFRRLWITFVVVEHCVLMMRVLILVVSPSDPTWIEDAREILTFRMKHRYKTKEEIEREKRYLEEYATKMQSGFRQLAAHLSGLTRQDLIDNFREIDVDHSGVLDQTELDVFLRVSLQRHGIISISWPYTVAKIRLPTHASAQGMGVEFSAKELAHALAEIDEDDGNEGTQTQKDGEISFDELINWMHKNQLWFDPGEP
eukprot:SAG31_NODE_1196_length_9445_cov_9.153970_4_plen_231_part_00